MTGQRLQTRHASGAVRTASGEGVNDVGHDDARRSAVCGARRLWRAAVEGVLCRDSYVIGV